MHTYKKIFNIISNILNSDTYVECSITEDEWKEIFALAKRHDILVFLEYYISKYKTQLNIPKNILEKIENNYKFNIAKSFNQMYAFKQIEEEFEKNNICTLFLKGVNTKKRYPNELLRTMGDIDILYKSHQTNKVKKVLETLGYTDFRQGRMHDSCKKLPYISLELHRTLISGDSEYFNYYKNIWDRCNLKPNCNFVYEMSLELEFIYNIIHLIEHFKAGGVGIRFIIDIYVYNHLPSLNKEYLIQELEKLKILEFYNNISDLAEYWFAAAKNEKVDPIIIELEKFIMNNGLFGTMQNASLLKLSDGKFNFALKVCFPSLNEMKSMYSWLNKAPYLLPVSWVIRAFDAIFNRRNSIAKQFSIYKMDNIDSKKSLTDFYNRCGL